MKPPIYRLWHYHQTPKGREDNSLRARRLTLLLRHDARLRSPYPCSLRRRARWVGRVCPMLTASACPHTACRLHCVMPTPSFALCTDTDFSTFPHRQLRLRHSRHNALRTFHYTPTLQAAPQAPLNGTSSHLLRFGSVSTVEVTPRLSVKA